MARPDPDWWRGFRARFVFYDNDVLWGALLILLFLAFLGERRRGR